MAKKTGRSAFAEKMAAKGAQQAFEQHKAEPVTYDSGGDLPAGIEGGIAQLSDMKFDVFKKGNQQGEYYFLASGTVVEPERYEGVRIRGLRTQIGPEPLCDTPGRKRETTADHIAWVINEMKKLGADFGNVDDVSELETYAEVLVREKPTFRFRTWKGSPTEQFPSPRTNHVWNGLCEPPDEPAPGGDVEDSTADSEPESEPQTGKQPEDLDALAAAADGHDNKAEDRLAEIATEVGIADAEIENAESWTDLVGMIRAKQEGGGGETGDELPFDENWKPEKEQVYRCSVNGKDGVEVEVTAVFEGKQTANVRDLEDRKMHKGIPWKAFRPVG